MTDASLQGARAIRQFRWGAGLVLITPLTLLALFSVGSTGAIISPSQGVVNAFVVLTIAVIALGAASLVGGYVLLWLGSRPRVIRGWMLRIGVILSAIALPLFIPVVDALVAVDPSIPGILVGISALFGFLCELAAIVCVVVGLTFAVGKGQLSLPRFPEAQATGRRIATVVAGLLLLVSVALGLYLGLVDDPLTQAGGRSLTSTYAALAKAGDLSSDIAMLVVWAVFWTIPIILFIVLGLLPARSSRLFNRIWTPRRIVTVALWIAGLVMVSQWFADFSMGMDLGDEVAPYTGGTSLFGAIYGLVALILLAAAVVRTVAPRRTVPARRSRPGSGARFEGASLPGANPSS